MVDASFSMRDTFENAKPFPHIILDGEFDDEMLQDIADEFPLADDARWTTYPDPKEYGKRAGGPAMWGPNTREYFSLMRSPKVCKFLEDVTGIGPLFADEIGGGMHMTGEGGRLDMHVDFNLHPDGQHERRLNVLTFITEKWDREWGGILYLGANREVEIVPGWNQTVVFATGETSWHGHPDPVVGDHWRKSLAVYYYAPLRPETSAAHSTVWLNG